MKYEYKFLAYSANITLGVITDVLNSWDDWEVISHSQTEHGMSLLLRRPKV